MDIMRTHPFTALLLLGFIWLAGCAITPLPAPQTPLNKNMNWDSRAKTLAAIDNWDLKALIAIRTKMKAESANLHWQHSGNTYQVTVLGPMGAIYFELNGSDKQVELQSAGGNKFYANSPEALITEQTGWNLPVSNLTYWIRGLPAPGAPAQKRFDRYNHLTVLSQSGWTIQYLRYTSVNNIDLPSKIVLDGPRLNVKIIISEWHI
jgi:outer membrane lipoprotein LolB